MRLAVLLVCLTSVAAAQDPVGTLEGLVIDHDKGVVTGAVATVVNLRTGLSRQQSSNEAGLFRFSLLPVGAYELTVESDGFSLYQQRPIQLNVSQTARVDVSLELASLQETITVTGDANLVDTATNTLGKVVTTREVLDLPLNGRNFTQLGLLQAGVAPVTSGLATAGGSLRSGHAFVVNGQRPESNNFLVDGARNVNRMDGGFALKIPVDAIAEFRILTHSAPPEYGGTSGSSTSLVTKSGGNEFHGSLYEFLRNDKLDARSYFSADVEPLKQNQFGGTLGGPIQRDKLFFFAYYEGFRNRQGVTRSGSVPTPAQRQGNFSGRQPPLVNIAAGGERFPNDQIPAALFDPVAQNVIALYPLGNTTPSVFTSTVVTQNENDQAGGRFDYQLSAKDQLWGRYSYSSGHNINPISIRGSDLPGFPVRDDLNSHSVALSHTHLFSPTAFNSLRATFFRHVFLFDQRLNQTPPRALGFNFDSASELGQGPPFFNVNGYSPVGGSITGPRTSAQNSWEVYDAVSYIRGNHSIKFGGETRWTQINAYQAIAPNAFFVFAPSFPSNDGFANLLMGRPVVFYQGRGDLSRGMRSHDSALFVQDQWRVNRRLTMNLGVRYEILPPFNEVRDRLNAFWIGWQSTVVPTAPAGLLFPGDEGVPRGIASVYRKGWMPRVGLAWDPKGDGSMSVRASYGIFYDQFANGMGLAFQGPVSSLPWTQFVQLSGPSVNFSDPYANTPIPAPNTFVQPSTVVAIDRNAEPPYSQNWNFSIQRSLWDKYLLEARYVGTKGTRLPRNIEANPAVYGPGATPQNADRRRIYANCRPSNGACDFTHVALLSYITNSTYHAGQLSLSRRFDSGLGFSTSYWFSKTLDYLSAMNMGGAAARPLAGENDIAQNPFDLRAEHGPSLFDARHRFVASGSWRILVGREMRGVAKALLDGWQVNGIASLNSATPFTVYDSTNVAMQAAHPPISGFAGSRPDLIADPNDGPKTVEQWISRDAFRRLDPRTEGGQFGNAGRNIARGPAFANIDLALFKDFRLDEQRTLQFRAECFNVANHANFALPVTDLASPNFGRILESGPGRLMQFALKLLF